MPYVPEEPIAAIATALSPSALGIVRASGKGAVDLCARIFSRPEALKAAKSAAMTYGWIMEPETKAKVDQVMVAVFRGPKSFTGEDMTEIYCHGGVNVVRGILRLLLAQGFRQAEPGEFTFRAYINGKTDLTRAEAVREITAARTDRAQSRAAGRLAGNLWDEISGISQLLLQSRAAMEAEIEYPEDENAIAGAFQDSQLRDAADRLERLAATWVSEKLYQEGVRVALCGRTNAGKSSLFNALLKEDRAIVSETQGTTRDWLESWASFEGLPVRLFDTAGLRETGDPVERAGVERTLDLAADADCILYIIDAAAGMTDEDRQFLTHPPGDSKAIPVIPVYNKVDKIIDKIVDEISENCYIIEKGCAISAKTGQGIPELIRAVAEVLGAAPGTEGGRQQAGLGSARQKAACQEALEAVQSGILAGEQGFPLDAVVQDIDYALGALGEIIGAITPEDILDQVFSRFCLGK
jgi:tRNA modification GTPase